MISDLPIVACSWLFIMALRGAATGAGSLGRLVLVLITVFSGCGVVGCGFGFGLGFGELAGFHIFRTSFLILIDCSTQPALRRLLIREKNFLGKPFRPVARY